MFDTKIAIIIREDLATWQKLNVTAFLMSGITGANPGIVGKTYQDRVESGILRCQCSRYSYWPARRTC